MPAEGRIQFAVASTNDGRVLIDFNTNMIDHMKLTPSEALDFAEAIVETAVQVQREGRVILSPFGGS